MSFIEKKLEELNIKIPVLDLKGKGLITFRRDGNLLYLSGHHCRKEDGKLIYEGKLGTEVSVEQGYETARQVGINMLRTLKGYLGNLDRVDKIIKVLGFVASATDFYKQAAVMNGFSDLMTEVFRERGQHARSAIGVAVLPSNMPVEVEVIVKIRD